MNHGPVCARDPGRAGSSAGDRIVVPIVFGSGKRYLGPVDGQHLLETPIPSSRATGCCNLRYRESAVSRSSLTAAGPRQPGSGFGAAVRRYSVPCRVASSARTTHR
ncbi:hypothetical protein B0T44_05765 [Nocardia donostiensis]|uniref:Uncharacterized protein n=1 Tax=Nocardia donostiensis TaxID=1538463 RepID=A0A1V2TK87_9NOCA|nr:hypothetical protein B0T46_05775 [Nocardia donostiensis]OQS13417.1 hypothetical protein B0T36_20200 [Nocardia donostiensis]OQS22162.1 hypothetical protein B0T44_05765 [Nocardia donostiensis]